MKYQSIYEWRDLEDGHFYRIGEAYPFDGREVSAERIAALSGAHNKAGCVLIAAIPEAETPTVKAPTADDGGEAGNQTVEAEPKQDKAKAKRKPRTAGETAEKP